MSKRAAFALAGATSLGLLLAAPGRATACSCVQASPAQHFQRAAVAFVGVAVATREPLFFEETTATAFAVEEVYKGTAPRAVLVRTARYGASCGMSFHPGARYEVLAAPGFETSLCSGSAIAPGALSALGRSPLEVYDLAGRTPEEVVGAFLGSGGRSLVGPIVASGLALLVAAAAFLGATRTGHVVRFRR
ncbi:MAG TPA: hypothetical protein VGB83_05610 [Actinomycetota bacterium]